jgi:TonB family protein
MKVMRASVAVALAAMLCLVAVIQLNASEELTRAKDLYRSASYDEALTVLDSIRPSAGAGVDEALEVHQFRVLCLVALDRKEDAKRAMAALITASPQYQLSDEDASPRVRSLFAEVRRSVMPTIVQRAYADAKTAFERKDPTATAQFDRVLVMLKDPDVAKEPSLADLATVVSGFRDLSVAAAAPVVAPPSASAATAATVRRPTTSNAIAAIVAPVAISQVLPPMPVRDQGEWNGEVEVLVDAAGKVTTARMTKSIHPAYDSAVLRAARNWTYKPATRDGVPTQMLKLVTIHIDTRPACGPRLNTSCRPNQ